MNIIKRMDQLNNNNMDQLTALINKNTRGGKVYIYRSDLRLKCGVYEFTVVMRNWLIENNYVIESDNLAVNSYYILTKS